MNALRFLVVCPLVGGAAGFLFGSFFSSGMEHTLKEEITVYVIAGAVAGLLLGITLAILALTRSVRSSETVSSKDDNARWQKHPAVRAIVVLGIVIFVVRLIMIFTIGH